MLRNHRKRLMVLLLGAPLAACTSLSGSDPLLYERLSARDVELAARVMQATLEEAPDGVTRRWQNGETGHRGAITPLRTWQSEEGHFCRDYREELVVGGESGRFQHTACRSGDERWVWI